MLELIAAGVNTDSSVNHLKALHPSLGDCPSLQQGTTSLLDSAADGLSSTLVKCRVNWPQICSLVVNAS